MGPCASFFLPLALYGPALSLIQGLTPPQMRSTVTGLTMLLTNVFAIAIGNLAAGALSDLTAGAHAPGAHSWQVGDLLERARAPDGRGSRNV